MLGAEFKPTGAPRKELFGGGCIAYIFLKKYPLH